MPPKDPMDTPRLLKIAEGFHVRNAVDNIAWIDLGDGLLVVDALEQPELEGEVLDAMASTVGKRPVRYVLNTHTHYDHVALNDALRRRGAEIVSNQGGGIPSGGRWFEGPARRVLMLPAPGCHTEEDCLVWVEQDRALFTGDIFGWGLVPLTRNLNAETSRLLEQTYQRMIGFDPAVVIPGHGPLCSKAHLERWLEYLRWLQREVGRGCQAGLSDSQVLEQLAPPADMADWWRFQQWKHQDSLEKVLKAVRRGWLG